jgi:glutamate dehydrogenase/leucine dehydrogenase
MGTSDADVIKFYEIAGLKDLAPSGLALKVRDGLPLGDQFTGYGVIVAAKTACRYADIDFEGATVAIEGFGKVGAGAARFASRMGARVVAVSTIEGGVYNPEGLDIENMIKLREKYGDACVLKYDGAERIDKEKIFELPVDILIPGARPDVINKNNVDRIKARVISEAANIPVTDEAERILFERGVVSAPDIVANSGGVISEVLERASGGSIDENRIFENIERMISSLLDDIFQNSLEQGVNPRELSIRIAKRRVIDRIQEERGRERPEIERIRDSIKKRFKL